MTQKAEWTIGAHTFVAADCRDGVLVDPELPDRFNATDNERRPEGHGKFWNLPFVVTVDGSTGLTPGYEVRCLDGGAWDRSTNWGKFPTIEEAIAQAKAGSPYR